MSLEDQIRMALDDFERAKPETIVDILNQIMPHFKSGLISEYLQGKIKKIHDAGDEQDKKKQCKALLPYLDWYLQGL